MAILGGTLNEIMQHLAPLLDPANWRVLGPLHLIFSVPSSPGKSEVPTCCPQHNRVPRKKLLTVAGISESERTVQDLQSLYTLPARLQVQPLLVRWQPPAANTPTHRAGCECGWRGCITGLWGQAETPARQRLALNVPSVTRTTVHPSPPSPKALAL